MNKLLKYLVMAAIYLATFILWTSVVISKKGFSEKQEEFTDDESHKQ